MENTVTITMDVLQLELIMQALNHASTTYYEAHFYAKGNEAMRLWETLKGELTRAKQTKVAKTYSQATDAEILTQRYPAPGMAQNNGSLNGRIIQDHAGDPLPEPMPDDETPEEWTRRKQADERVQSQRDALEDPSAR